MSNFLQYSIVYKSKDGTTSASHYPDIEYAEDELILCEGDVNITVAVICTRGQADRVIKLFQGREE